MTVATDYNEKLAILNQAIEDDPHDYQPWFEKSKILFELQRLDEALTSIEKVLNIYPDDLDVQLLKEEIQAAKVYSENIYAEYYSTLNQFSYKWLEYNNYKENFEKEKQQAIAIAQRNLQQKKDKLIAINTAIKIDVFNEPCIKSFSNNLSSEDIEVFKYIAELQSQISTNKRKIETSVKNLDKLKDANLKELMLIIGISILSVFLFRNIIAMIVCLVIAIFWRRSKYEQLVKKYKINNK